MRLLTKTEIDLVAGGWGSSDYGGGCTLWGGDGGGGEWYDPSWYSYEIGNGGQGGGGGGEPEPEPQPTPCVEASPDGLNLTDINRAALMASNAIASYDDETYEYGVIIYSLGGTIMTTSVFTQYLTDSIDWNAGIAEIPDGAEIVGIVHNHPDRAGINDTIPSSGQDWQAYDAILAWSGSTRGITADPNMLMYIYSNEDHKTHVYDNTDKNTTTTSSSLQ